MRRETMLARVPGPGRRRRARAHRIEQERPAHREAFPGARESAIRARGPRDGENVGSTPVAQAVLAICK